MSRQVSRGSAVDYEADELAGVSGLAGFSALGTTQLKLRYQPGLAGVLSGGTKEESTSKLIQLLVGCSFLQL